MLTKILLNNDGEYDEPQGWQTVETSKFDKQLIAIALIEITSEAGL